MVPQRSHDNAHYQDITEELQRSEGKPEKTAQLMRDPGRRRARSARLSSTCARITVAEGLRQRAEDHHGTVARDSGGGRDVVDTMSSRIADKGRSHRPLSTRRLRTGWNVPILGARSSRVLASTSARDDAWRMPRPYGGEREPGVARESVAAKQYSSGRAHGRSAYDCESRARESLGVRGTEDRP